MHTSPHWRRWLSAALRAALPSQCALCGMAAAELVCAPCHADFVAPARLRCLCCANPLADHVEAPAADARAAEPDAVTAVRWRPRCPRCVARAPAFDATVAAVDYAPPLDQLVLRLKFAAELATAPWCARVLADAVRAHPDLPRPDMLCPVPLSAARLIERGFNQALEIARPLARALDLPLEARLLVRRIDTRAQSSVAPRERESNIRNAFVLAPHDAALVRGRHIGLVDDVMTSGHTLGELAALLKRHGAARVTNYVFARTPPA